VVDRSKHASLEMTLQWQSMDADCLVPPMAVFEQVRRVLKPGGRLVLTFSDPVFAVWAYKQTMA
jgi:SAM-dependent methyltransferase